MYFELTEEQIMIRQAARDFAQTELKPGVIYRDEHQKFPTEQIRMLGELGFLGMMVSPQYGGSGMDDRNISRRRLRGRRMRNSLGRILISKVGS